MHDNRVPRLAVDRTKPVLNMKFQSATRLRFEGHSVVQPRLLSKSLEQRRHPADTAVVQIGHRARMKKPHRRPCAKGEAVADEQHLGARLGQDRA